VIDSQYLVYCLLCVVVRDLVNFTNKFERPPEKEGAFVLWHNNEGIWNDGRLPEGRELKRWKIVNYCKG